MYVVVAMLQGSDVLFYPLDLGKVSVMPVCD